ncbi:decaprenyl-phosphate phosphoribosyltransferase [candidate division KSB1 bacterium]|nr:decaprenyl-phosphate phosphoribosyltransferase [candidate division KSB1 bacterium]
MLKALLVSMRPKQWLKNVIVFAGLYFAKDVIRFEKLSAAFIAFACFCLLSSGGYLLNDLFDRDKDRLHPRKKFRPIAAGTLSPWIALVSAIFFIIISLWAGFECEVHLGYILVFYLFLTFSYSLYLKRIIILDVIIIALGFVLRAIGGTIAIHEEVSSWLVICTIFLALFLALTKRRSEFQSLGQRAAEVRKTFGAYTAALLDQMIISVTAACFIAYTLYTLNSDTIEKFGTRNLALTLPFVIYGLFRYLYLVHSENFGENPETALLYDPPILICVLAYLLSVAVVIYF